MLTIGFTPASKTDVSIQRFCWQGSTKLAGLAKNRRNPSILTIAALNWSATKSGWVCKSCASLINAAHLINCLDMSSSVLCIFYTAFREQLLY